MLEWQENLSIGVLEIDVQHRLLFDKVNAFLAALHTETESDGLYRLFWFLEAYAITHFREEEKLMRQVAFPDFPKHRESHLAFTREIGNLKERLKNEGTTQSLINTITMFISGWLIQHISNMDRAIGRFLNATEIATLS